MSSMKLRNADILDADQIVRTAECVAAAAGNNSVILVVTLDSLHLYNCSVFV